MRHQWKAKSAEPRFCEHCKTLLERKHNPAGRLEDFRTFMKRRFCSLSCANSRSKGGKSRKAAHYHARKSKLGACECCGATKRLQVHHVNEDWTNNSPENLQTLCIFCHHFWHATLRRLGVTPTERMPRLVFPLNMGLPEVWDECAPIKNASPRYSRAKTKAVGKDASEDTVTRSSLSKPQNSSAPQEKQ